MFDCVKEIRGHLFLRNVICVTVYGPGGCYVTCLWCNHCGFIKWVIWPWESQNKTDDRSGEWAASGWHFPSLDKPLLKLLVELPVKGNRGWEGEECTKKNSVCIRLAIFLSTADRMIWFLSNNNHLMYPDWVCVLEPLKVTTGVSAWFTAWLGRELFLALPAQLSICTTLSLVLSKPRDWTLCSVPHHSASLH